MSTPAEPNQVAIGETFGSNQWNGMVNWMKYMAKEIEFEALFIAGSNSN